MAFVLLNRNSMKPRFSNQRNHALTLIEVLVVIFVLVVLVAIILPALAKAKIRGGPNCVNNLKEIGLAYRVWEGDNGDKYPMGVSVTNGGSMEMVATGNVVQTFLVMSNELSTPKILVCAQDKEHKAATNFYENFTSKNISYFVGVDADESKPQMILSGDDNFEISGAPIKSGLIQISTNADVAWASARHVYFKVHFWTPKRERYMGNIGLADCSVQQVSTVGLQQSISQTGVTTNRLAIP